MAVEIDIEERLEELLACGDIESVKSFIDEDNFDLVLHERAFDIIPTVSFYITDDTMDNNPELFNCCERILTMCAERGNPKECLAEFQAQMQSLDEVKFKTFLIPLQTALLRIPERKGPITHCAFNDCHSFINSLSTPQYYHLDSNSKLLLDCDESTMKIRDVYRQLLEFFTPFVKEASVKCNDTRIKDLRLVLLQALFRLLGYPLVFLDLEFSEKDPSAFRSFASSIVAYINMLQSDQLTHLTLVEDKQLVTVEEEKELIKDYSYEIRFSDLSFASYYYLVFVENLHSSLPSVYDKDFIVQNCFSLAATLLRYKERMVLRKGLLLTKVTVQKVQPGGLAFFNLASDRHKEIIDLLSKISIYHDVEEDRKLAIELVKQYFFMFEAKAQYYILFNFSSNITSHPNIIGYFITLLTKLIQNVFVNDVLKEYFTGKRLFDLLNIFCSLKKGSGTDLIENKEQILPALNLIIFLTKRDKENFTGVWDYTDKLSKRFLCPLREGIKLSRAHFKVELDKLNDPAKNEDTSKLSVRVGTEEVSNMSVELKKEVINSGFTVFDLIEHVLCIATESIEDKSISFV